MQSTTKLMAVFVVLVAVTVSTGAFVLITDSDKGSALDNEVGQINTNEIQTWTSGDCTCTLDDNGVFTVTGQGAMQDYLTASNQPWYSVSQSITSVAVQSGVTSIGENAFMSCASLATVTIGNSVETIGNDAFDRCTTLTTVTIPDSVTSIGNNAFVYCTSLTSVTIGNSVQTIGIYAFRNCTSLTSVTIGNSVQTIGNSAFRDCTSLASVTIPNSVTSISSDAFRDCTSLVDIFFLTTTWNITSIGSNAFSLGKLSVSVTATVHSPNNVANGQLDAYKGDYTTLTYVANPWTVTVNVNNPEWGSVNHPTFLVEPSRLCRQNGNAITSVPPQATYCVATPSPTTEHYTYAFDHWEGLPFETQGYFTQDVTITAVFARTVQQYEVSIVSNNTSYGTVSPTSVTVDYGTSISVSGNTLILGSTNVVATPTPSTSQYTYAFQNWSNVPQQITEDITITANFTRMATPYTVSFQTADATMGTVSVASQTIGYGTEIAYYDDGGVKTVPATYTYSLAVPNEGFEFDYWEGVAHSPSTTTVTGDMTLIAHFKPQFFVRATIVVNDPNYGSVDVGFITVSKFNTVTVADNVLTVYDPYSNSTYTCTATPATSTAEFTYGFDSWSNVPQQITEDITITANFTRTLNWYTVTVTPNDLTYGSVSLGSISVPYNTEIYHSGNVLYIGEFTSVATPAEPVGTTRYTFTNWSGVPVSERVTGDVAVTAVFTQTDYPYVVYFVTNDVNYGDTNISSVSAQAGSTITVSGNNIVVEGITVTAVATPATAQYIYRFLNWTGVPSTVTEDVTITANFTRETQEYMVKFEANNDAWGTISPASVRVPYGTVIYTNNNEITISTYTVTATPHAQTAWNNYSFIEWVIDDPNIDGNTVKGNATVTARFSEAVRTYTITVVTDPADGSYGSVTVSSIIVDAGVTLTSIDTDLYVDDVLVSSAVPKPDTIQYKYEFSQWTGIPVQRILDDYTITAHFTRALQQYTVTFQPSDGVSGVVKVDGSQIYVPVLITVDFGTQITVSGHEVVLGDGDHVAIQEAQQNYTFIRWNGIPADMVVKDNITISATFWTLEIVFSDESKTMYCVNGAQAPWQYNQFSVSLNLPTEGTWSIVDPNNTGLTIDADTGVFGGVISMPSNTGIVDITVKFVPSTDEQSEVSAVFKLYYEPKLVIKW